MTEFLVSTQSMVYPGHNLLLSNLTLMASNWGLGITINKFINYKVCLRAASV